MSKEISIHFTDIKTLRQNKLLKLLAFILPT